MVVGLVALDDGRLGSEDSQDGWWDTGRASQDGAMVLRKDALESFFKHLHWELVVGF